MKSKIECYPRLIAVDVHFPPGTYVRDDGMSIIVEDLPEKTDLPESIDLRLNRREFIDLIQAEIEAGHKLQAIKYIRRATGWTSDRAVTFVNFWEM